MAAPEKATPGGSGQASAEQTTNVSSLPTATKIGNSKTGRTRYVRLFPDRIFFLVEMLDDRELAAWLRLTVAYVMADGALPSDDKKLALTLSGSNGNLDIYLLDLASQQLTRITEDPGIDTEASFAPDGSIYFTSDRSGSPQVYRVMPGSTERARRVTFTGSYNARPRVSPDGKQLGLLTLAEGSYRIAVQDLASGTLNVLSKGRQEESPSFAPNGAMLIFAGRERGQGVLQTVSTDGLTTARLDADAGEVREPVWGPFLP